jgi:hypothetical protein
MSTATQKKSLVLSGYVIGVFGPREKVKAGNKIFHFPELRWPLKNGAELLHLETLDGEQRSKEDFLLWWNNQVGNASDDGKTVIVLGAAHPCFPNSSYRKWLEERKNEDGVRWFADLNELKEHVSKPILCLTVGVFWPPTVGNHKVHQWNTKREYELVKFGAQMLHLHLKDGQTKEDFLIWFDAEARKANTNGTFVVIKDNDWMEHLVCDECKLPRQWLNEKEERNDHDNKHPLHFVQWRKLVEAYCRRISVNDLPRPEIQSDTCLGSLNLAANNLPLSGYTAAVYWPPETATTSIEDRIIRSGAKVLHLHPPNNAEISKQDFVEWWEAKTKEVHAVGSTLFVLSHQYSFIPTRQIDSWLKEIEENEWMGDGSNEHLHVRFVKWGKLQEAIKGGPLVDSWGDVLEKQHVV